MPTQVTNYQCPACTGPLHFVGASGTVSYTHLTLPTNREV